jgi:PKD repeat protein
MRIGTASVPPLADAGGPYTGSAGAPVNFDGTGSSDLDDNITTWAWDFGDGNTGEGENTSNRYDETGIYIVRLTVTDGSGETDTDVTKVTVGEGSLPPVADAGDTVKGAVGALVIFDGTGSRDPNGGTLTYRWDFGDDTGVSRSAAPSYKYSEEGYYRVTLEVTNSDDKKDSDTTLAVVIETKESCFESCDDARDEALVVCDTVPFWERWGCWLNAFLDHLQCKEACQ